MPQTVIQIAILLGKCGKIYEKCDINLYEVEIKIHIFILIGYSVHMVESNEGKTVWEAKILGLWSPALYKGQLMSEWDFSVFKSPKKQTKSFERFLP